MAYCSPWAGSVRARRNRIRGCEKRRYFTGFRVSKRRFQTHNGNTSCAVSSLRRRRRAGAVVCGCNRCCHCFEFLPGDGPGFGSQPVEHDAADDAEAEFFCFGKIQSGELCRDCFRRVTEIHFAAVTDHPDEMRQLRFCRQRQMRLLIRQSASVRPVPDARAGKPAFLPLYCY